MNRLINCDCVVGARTLETGAVALTVTSPPYDRLRDFAPFDFEALADELYRITMKGGVVVWVVGDQIVEGSETGTSFRQALHFKEVGFRLQTMIYSPLGKTTTNPNRYGLALQYMFVLTKGKPRCLRHICDHRNKTAGTWRTPRSAAKGRKSSRHQVPIRTWGRRSTIWTYPVGSASAKDRFAFEHPALMPEALARDLILSWSKPGDLVLDPFSGAGTTAKMAMIHGRRYIGFEINPSYHQLGCRRVREAVLQVLGAA